MSLLKSEVKQLVAHEIGVRVDDALEAAHRDLAVLEGKQIGLLDGAKAVEALQVSVDKDIEEGQYDLEVAAKLKRYLTRAVHALQNMAQQAGSQRIAANGRVQGLEHSIKLLKGVIDEESKKAEALRAAESDDRLSIKAQRLAEEQNEAPRASNA